jgi:hypoxanthine phosphoribosyltransferase
MSTLQLDHIREVKKTATCLHDRQAVACAFDRMAAEISRELADKNPLVISLMNGGMISTSELLLRLDFVCQVDFIHASRYREKTAGGSRLNWLVKPHQLLKDRYVLLVDDILDEGMTLYEVVQFCKREGAKQVYTAVLADKKHERRTPEGFKADFTGLEIEDRYVFGCGMDYRGYLRNVNGIYAVAEHLLK